MKMTPLISVIKPAYHAQKTIKRAIDSVRSAGLPMAQLQIVIAPDDGQGYEF